MNIDLVQPSGILCVLRIITSIGKLIHPSCQTDRILRDESSQLRIIPTGAIVEQAGQRIAFTAGIVVTGVVAAGAVTESVVFNLVHDMAFVIGKRRCATQMICCVIERSLVFDGAGLPDFVVDAGAIQVVDCAAIAVQVFHYVLAIVDEVSGNAIAASVRVRCCQSPGIG